MSNTNNLWPLLQFQFHERIAQLTYTFPEDATTSTGSLFWSAPKRFPEPLTFDPADPSHVAFAQAGAILKAQVHNIQVPSWAANLRKVVIICQYAGLLLLIRHEHQYLRGWHNRGVGKRHVNPCLAHSASCSSTDSFAVWMCQSKLAHQQTTVCGSITLLWVILRHLCQTCTYIKHNS